MFFCSISSRKLSLTKKLEAAWGGGVEGAEELLDDGVFTDFTDCKWDGVPR